MTERIRASRARIVHRAPFFASLLMKLQLAPDLPGVNTMSTDGRRLAYNREWVSGLSDVELDTTLAHEALHIANLHPVRQSGRDARHWNIACDHAINTELKRMKWFVPEHGLCDPVFDGMSAEQIYTLLSRSDDAEADEGSGDDPGGMGAVMEPDGPIDELERDLKASVIAAAMMAKQAGQLPGNLQRLVDQIREPAADWREILRDHLTPQHGAEWAWHKPNRRFIARGMYLPGVIHPDPPAFGVSIDASGSVTDELLAEFTGELSGILNDVRPSELSVSVFDTEMRSLVRFEPGDEVRISADEAGGGTSFRCIMDGHDPDIEALVVLTDGVCWSFPDDPGIPVLWVIWGGCDFDPPFGDVIEFVSTSKR